MICADCSKEKPHYSKGVCRSCYCRRLLAEHGEEIRAYKRRWREANREKEQARCRRWREGHPKEDLARHHRYYQQHRKEKATHVHRWREANPERVVVFSAHRRAHKLAVADTLTPGQTEFERKIGEATYPGEKLHLHHLIPLSKSGNHSWGNIIFIPASLNSRIGNKLPREVYQQESLNIS